MKISNEDFNSYRGKLALKLLSNGDEGIQIENKSISLIDFDEENITLLVWSDWQIENIDKEKARIEILKGKQNYIEMLQEWDDLNELLLGKGLSCYLHSDYGTGSIRICSLQSNENINWEAYIK